PHFNLHHRLQQHGLRQVHRLAHALDTGHLERPLGRVHRVGGAVNQRSLDVDDGIAGHGAVFHGVTYAVLGRTDVLARDGPADGLVVENEAGAALTRFTFQPDHAVLAAAAGLADVASF